MNRRLLLLLPIVLTMLACSMTSLATPVATIVVKPTDAEKADLDSLEQAKQIIEKRLDAVGIRATLSVSDEKISVALYSAADLHRAEKLSTETGAFIFADSLEIRQKGYVFDKLPDAVLTQNDIQSAFPEQSAVFPQYYNISILLTAAGTKKMADYSAKNVNHYVLVIKDGIVLLAPQLGGTVTDGQIEIASQMDQSDATVLVAELRLPALPLGLQVDSITPTAVK